MSRAPRARPSRAATTRRSLRLAFACSALPGCIVSSSLHRERPLVEIERLETVARTPDGSTIVDATLSNGESRRFAIDPAAPWRVAKPVDLEITPIPAGSTPLFVFPTAQEPPYQQHHWRPTDSALAAGIPSAWFEHVDRHDSNWQRVRYDQLWLEPGDGSTSKNARVTGIGQTDWTKAGAWWRAAALPLAFAVDLATFPIQAFGGLAAAESVSYWTHSW